jgi:hypothetical protein
MVNGDPRGGGTIGYCPSGFRLAKFLRAARLPQQLLEGDP